MKAQLTKDMTNGSPTKLILEFAIPMLFGLLFQQLYNMADTIIVGRFLGVDALAGVGSTSSINFMINGFVIGLSSGFSIPVAQRFGAKDYKDMRRFVANIIWLYILFSIIMTAILVVSTYNVLIIMNTPKNIIKHAYNYIFIVFAGVSIIFGYNILAAIMRSLGDSKTPVYFLVISSVINVILDIVFILNLGTGVEGAAYATLISQGFSALLCLFYMRKKFDILKLDSSEMHWHSKYISTLCAMGIPMGLQYSITAIGSIILQVSVNSLGSIAVASVAAGQKINNFFAAPFDSLGGTMATYTGQNIGAGKIDRIRYGVRQATIIGSIYAVMACIIIFFFGDRFALFFVKSTETVVISQAHLYTKICSFFFIPLVFVNVWRFSIQGMGYSILAILAGVAEMFARIIIAIFFVPLGGYFAVGFASPLAWTFATLFLIPAFYHCINRTKKLLSKRFTE